MTNVYVNPVKLPPTPEYVMDKYGIGITTPNPLHATLETVKARYESGLFFGRCEGVTESGFEQVDFDTMCMILVEERVPLTEAQIYVLDRLMVIR